MLLRPMTMLRPAMASTTLLTLACLLAMGVFPAFAGSWSIAMLGGPASRYADLGSTDFATAWVALAGERCLRGSLALRAEAGYLGYRSPLYQSSAAGLPGTPLSQPPGSQQTAQFIPVSVGVRFYQRERPDPRTRGYLQVAPALFLVRGTERIIASWYGESPRRWDDSFVVLRPGFLAGIGLKSCLGDGAHAELGFRYLRSGRIGQQGLRGLSTLALVIGVGAGH